MPLRAQLGHDPLYAPDIPAGEWAAMKGRTPRPVLICGQDAVAKTSVLGNPFFAHLRRVDDHEHKGESPEHLRIKAAIVEAARAAGWNADVEVPPEGRRDWVADVLAVAGTRRIAFEVQLASQTREIYRHRQERYARDGVECFWLVRRLNEDIHHGLPAVQVDPTALTVTAGADTHVDLAAFIRSVLQSQLRWKTETAAPVTVTCRWGLHECAQCVTLSVVHRIDDATTVSCPDCTRTAQGPKPPIRSGRPERDRDTRGVAAPFATGTWPEFHCPACGTDVDRRHVAFLENDRTPHAETSQHMGTARQAAHWCADGHTLSHSRDAISFLAQQQPAEPRTLRTEPTGRQLERQAQQRPAYFRDDHKRQEQERQAAAAKALRRAELERTARLREAEHDAKVEREREQYQRLADMARENHLMSRTRVAQGGGVPASGDAPGTDRARVAPRVPFTPLRETFYAAAHTRTAAIGELHDHPTAEQKAIPAPLAQECNCATCAQIRARFPPALRWKLWPSVQP